MTEHEAITWCKAHNASVRFDNDGTVIVTVMGTVKRRRSTLELAVESVREWCEKGRGA